MPEPNKPTQEPVQDVAALRQQLDELQKRYTESSTEGKRLAADAKRLADENRAMHLQAGGQAEDTDVNSLRESGIDVEALNRFIQRSAGAAADTRLRPLFNAAQAQQGVPAEMQAKANALLASDSTLSEEYTAIVQVNPAAAAKFLTSQVRLHDAEAGMAQESDEVKKQRQRDRVDAGITPSRSDSRETESEASPEQAAARRKALIDAGRAAGGINKALASEFLRGKITVIDRLDKPPRVI